MMCSTIAGFSVRVDDGFDYSTVLVNNVDFRVEPLNNLAKGLPVYRLVSLSGIFPRSNGSAWCAGDRSLGLAGGAATDP
jgi:hypothetical protein